MFYIIFPLIFDNLLHKFLVSVLSPAMTFHPSYIIGMTIKVCLSLIMRLMSKLYPRWISNASIWIQWI